MTTTERVRRLTVSLLHGDFTPASDPAVRKPMLDLQ